MPMNIKGNLYYTVAERITEFRTNEKYDGYSMTTEIYSLNAEQVIMKSTVKDKDDRIVADGFAEEVYTDDYKKVNSTSMIENCQTSAHGRALGNLGILSELSVASADEVENAISRQENTSSRRSTRTVNNTQTEQPQKTATDFEEVWYSGEGPVNQFELFMVGEETYKCMKKKADGTLFGLNVNDNCDPSLKFFSFK